MNAATYMLRLREVLKRTGLSRSQVYRLQAGGSFPKRIKFGGASVWVEAELEEWLRNHIDDPRRP